MRLLPPLFGRVKKWTKAYANLPEEYLQRILFKSKTPPLEVPQFNRPRQRPPKIWFSVTHPWDVPSEMQTSKKYAPVEPILNWSYFPGDVVQILEGKDKGKLGKVKAVYEERNWVLVEGCNIKLNRTTDPKLGDTYFEEEQPLLITEVSLIDPKTRQPTEIEWRYTQEGEKVRVSLATEAIIPIPQRAYETVDYIKPELYVERSKDTKADDAKEITFKPELKTFEMDIMEKMGIKEDRIPKKYYWY